jgi:hypothetical protein
MRSDSWRSPGDYPRQVVGRSIIRDNDFPRPWPILGSKRVQRFVDCAAGIATRNDDAECHGPPDFKSLGEHG